MRIRWAMLSAASSAEKYSRRGPRHVGPLLRDAVRDLDDLLARSARDEHLRAVERRARRDRPEVLLDELLRLGRVEVAGDREREVRRRVVLPEELLRVVERRGLEVLVAPDDGPAVGVARGEDVLPDELVPAAVGGVLEPLAALVPHDLALLVELGLGERLAERREPVRLEPEEVLEVGRRDRREVVRPVEVRRPVDAPLAEVGARLLDVGEVLARDVLRALEHQVLEEVGEPRPARLLVLRADVEPLVHVDDRELPVDVQDDLQAVRERVLLERDLRGRGVGGGAGFWARATAATRVIAAATTGFDRRIESPFRSAGSGQGLPRREGDSATSSYADADGRVARRRPARRLRQLLGLHPGEPRLRQRRELRKSAASGARKLKHAFPCILLLRPSEIPFGEVREHVDGKEVEGDVVLHHLDAAEEELLLPLLRVRGVQRIALRAVGGHLQPLRVRGEDLPQRLEDLGRLLRRGADRRRTRGRVSRTSGSGRVRLPPHHPVIGRGGRSPRRAPSGTRPPRLPCRSRRAARGTSR